MTDHAATPKPKPTADEIIARIAAFRARMEEERRKQLEEMKAVRAALLTILRAAGVTEIAAEYDGQCDSGNVEELDVRPTAASATLPGHVVAQLQEFVWDLAYANHPGFENNEGGFGEVTWNIEADHIDLIHNERIETVETTIHEGI